MREYAQMRHTYCDQVGFVGSMCMFESWQVFSNFTAILINFENINVCEIKTQFFKALSCRDN